MDIVGLCRIYGASTAQERELIALAESKEKHSWMEQYAGGIPRYAQKYIEMERRAARIFIYESEFTTGLFQTEGYIRANHERDWLHDSASSAKILNARLARQHHLAMQPSRPAIHLIENEAALRRAVGGQEVTGEQIRTLRDAAGRENVTIGVLPFSVGSHPAMAGSFILIDFDAEEPPVVYIETRAGCRYDSEPKTVEMYRKDFNEIERLSVPIEEFVDDCMAEAQPQQ